MEYKSFTIKEKLVYKGRITSDYYTLNDQMKAYQIVDPLSEYIYGTYSSQQLAQEAIDRNGERWKL